jgi:peptide/nickel transport system permease protein
VRRRQRGGPSKVGGRGRRLGDSAGRSSRFGASAWVAATFLVLLFAAAIAAPILPIWNPTASDYTAISAWPSPSHLLGTDQLGRDLLSRVIWGARDSLTVGIGSTIIGAAVGTLIGTVAGFFGGKVQSLLMRLMDILLAFPAIVLALAVLAAVGSSLQSVVVIIGVLFIPGYARMVRAPVLSLRQRDFVLACAAVGMSRTRIMLREVLPNVVPLITNFGLATFGISILIEGGLGFLGVSVPPPTPTWGGMVASGQQVLSTNPLVCLVPAAALAGVVFAANVLGDALSRRTDSKAGQLG